MTPLDAPDAAEGRAARHRGQSGQSLTDLLAELGMTRGDLLDGGLPADVSAEQREAIHAANMASAGGSAVEEHKRLVALDSIDVTALSPRQRRMVARLRGEGIMCAVELTEYGYSSRPTTIRLTPVRRRMIERRRGGCERRPARRAGSSSRSSGGGSSGDSSDTDGPSERPRHHFARVAPERHRPERVIA